MQFCKIMFYIDSESFEDFLTHVKASINYVSDKNNRRAYLSKLRSNFLSLFGSEPITVIK